MTIKTITTQDSSIEHGKRFLKMQLPKHYSSYYYFVFYVLEEDYKRAEKDIQTASILGLHKRSFNSIRLNNISRWVDSMEIIYRVDEVKILEEVVTALTIYPTYSRYPADDIILSEIITAHDYNTVNIHRDF